MTSLCPSNNRFEPSKEVQMSDTINHILPTYIIIIQYDYFVQSSFLEKTAIHAHTGQQLGKIYVYYTLQWCDIFSFFRCLTFQTKGKNNLTHHCPLQEELKET